MNNTGNTVKLIILKSDKFKYIDKSYIQKRYVSEDKKFFFSVDEMDYVKAYKAESDGKATLVYEIYHQNNYNSYPIYSLDDAVKKTYAKVDTDYTLKVHPSQLTAKTIKIQL